MSRFSRIQASLEQIDFQKSDVFFKELTAAVGQLRVLENPSKDSMDIVGIPQIVQHHTGLSIKTIYHYGFFDGKFTTNAMVEPPIIHAGSPLFMIHGSGMAAPTAWRKAFADDQHVFKGTIDRSTGRVTGVFSQVSSTVHLYAGLFRKLTDAEIAAVTLHEIGHIFTYFDTLKATVATAVALSICSSAYTASTSKEERISLVEATAEQLGSKVNATELAESNNVDVVQSVMITNITSNIRSAAGCEYFDFRIWEVMADQYASRQGATRDLATGIDKILRSGNWLNSSSGTTGTAIYWIFNVIKSYVTIAGILASTGFMLGLEIGLIIMRMISSIPQEGNYDRAGERLDRIRSDLIAALKDETNSTERQLSIQSDIALLDEVKSSYVDRSDFMQIIWKNLTSYRRNNYTQIEFQQELEHLANNNMFLAASRLSTLNR